MTDGVDAAMHGVQPAARNHVCDGMAADAEGDQLTPSDGRVLTSCQLGERVVGPTLPQ